MAPAERWTIVLMLLVALATAPLAAASEGVLEAGTHDIPAVLLVGENDTLVLAPGASLTGAGSLEVWGRLEVRGEPGRPVQVAVPVRLHGAQAHALSHARFYGANGTMLHVLNGTADLLHLVFESNAVGLEVSGPARVEGANLTFRAHPGAGLRVNPGARADLQAVALEDNAVGVRVEPGGILRLHAPRALGNRIHLSADAAPTPEGPAVALRDVDLGPAAATEGAAALDVRTRGAPDGAPAFTLHGGRIHGSPVGILAAGPAPLRIEDADVVENAVGLSLRQAVVELRDVRLGNGRDLDGAQTSRLSLDNVTHLRPDAGTTGAATLAPGASPPAWWVPWLAMGGVLVLASAILWSGRTRRAPPPSPAPAPAQPEPAQDPAPDATPEQTAAATPAPEPLELGPQERRILLDVLAHPDTPQAAIAERIGITRQAVHYHVKKLEARGLLSKSVRGRETQCRVTAAAEPLLRA